MAVTEFAKNHRVSDAKYYLNCAGWSQLMGRHRAALEKREPAHPNRIAGIAKHELIEKLLRENKQPTADLINKRWTKNERGQQLSYVFTATDIEQVSEAVAHIRDRATNLSGALGFSELGVDVNAFFPKGDPNWRAYLDFVLVHPEQIELIEFKWGRTPVYLEHDDPKRFPVDEQDFCGIAALIENRDFMQAAGIDKSKIKRIRLTVFQPNGQDVPPWQHKFLTMARYEKLLSRARKAVASYRLPKVAPVAGSWCSYCPGQPVCLPFAAYAFRDFDSNPTNVANLERELLEDPNLVPLDRIQDLVRILPLLQSYISQVRKFAVSCAKDGVEFPGHKLIRRRSRSQWIDETRVKELVDGVMPVHAAYDAKLKTPKQLTAAAKMSAPQIVARLEEEKHTPEGAFELVPETAPVKGASTAPTVEQMFNSQ